LYCYKFMEEIKGEKFLLSFLFLIMLPSKKQTVNTVFEIT